MSGHKISKARACRSREKSSKAWEKKLLEAAKDHQAESKNLASDAAPVPTAAKSQLDAVPSASSLLLAKTARLGRADATDGLGVDEEAEFVNEGIPPMQTTLQQPKPSKRPYAAFLADSTDTARPPAGSELSHASISILEWLESIGSGRVKRSRSNCCREHDCEGHPVSRRLARSAPATSSTRDADNFIVPPTPVSTGSRVIQAGTDAKTDADSVAPSDATGVTPNSAARSSSGKSLVEEPFYRDMNLAANNIYMQPHREQLPDHIQALLDHVRRPRTSPSPSASDDLRQDDELYQLQLGTGEPEVEEYCKTYIFPKPGPVDGLQRSNRQPMTRNSVPTTTPKLRVSTPVPDLLYGYSRYGAFSPQQQTQLIAMGTDVLATNQAQSLLYPFFVVEFKGDGGSMWVATNQCLGGAASCVHIAERLNRQLRRACTRGEIQAVDSVAFSVAMNGAEARLYVSWKHDDELAYYYMAHVQSFLLQDAEHYRAFRNVVRNIVDWGKDDRLNRIRASLDTLLGASRRRATEAAKSRSPPSEGSTTSSKKPASSSRRSSSSSTKATGSKKGKAAKVDAEEPC
ncbi:hypothetical protein SPI_04184 [Niveomyces insectorum RCEF 264]|uniref:DUF7924 domain-containing protein n=1 Tax=Niveomyces insectorum RCEF 264 TaxID=1081102 RepID=A0A167VI49_9HYPO|nr:hypothetical protein SPI_04184 [Niveomyces insectorum RCEF 264]